MAAAKTSEESQSKFSGPDTTEGDASVTAASAFSANRNAVNPFLSVSEEDDMFTVPDNDEWAYTWKRVDLVGDVDGVNLGKIMRSRMQYQIVHPSELHEYSALAGRLEHTTVSADVIRRGDLVLFKFPAQNRRWAREAKEAKARKQLSKFNERPDLGVGGKDLTSTDSETSFRFIR